MDNMFIVYRNDVRMDGGSRDRADARTLRQSIIMMSDPDVASLGPTKKCVPPFPASTQNSQNYVNGGVNFGDNTSRCVIVNSINGWSERHNYGHCVACVFMLLGSPVGRERRRLKTP